MKRSVSVVIPTMGRPILIKTLESLVAAKGFDQLEVIVAGKIAEAQVQADLDAMCAKHPQIRHLPVSFDVGDSSEKKNSGAREAKGEIIAFLDDDVVVAPEWPVLVSDPFDDPEVGLVSGPSLVPDDISLIGRLAGVALQSRAAGYVSERYLKGEERLREVKWSRTIGCNMAYRREAFEKVGGFDPEFWPGEEMFAAFTAGKHYKLLFNPHAYVLHYPRESLGKFWKQMHGYGATRIRLIRAGVEFEPATIVPGIWVFSLLVLGLGMLVWRPLGWLLLLDLILYVIVDAAITLEKFAETRRLIDLLIFFLIPVMHVSYGIAEWFEFFRPGKDLSENPV